MITNETLNQKIPVINEVGTCIANLVPISHKECDINLISKNIEFGYKIGK